MPFVAISQHHVVMMAVISRVKGGLGEGRAADAPKNETFAYAKVEKKDDVLSSFFESESESILWKWRIVIAPF